ncbi:MAG: 5'-nucleotidase, lipoprotein e(P4) family [Deltaproteobacteria bacterium RIFOXYA12_FULL_61_11]|nr:MAG: 5'-nucleotidase, lipoprotein e(P4) family [Deltaproteobacteria bacterium RIFOXYA12_FULL_61_11]
MAVLWHQTSAEYRALCYQAFNIARERLEEALAHPSDRPRAVIIDVDETVLDNALYDGYLVLNPEQYPEDFYRWLRNGPPRLIPGAADFLAAVDRAGVAIFYLTNRRTVTAEDTLRQLSVLGLPQLGPDRLLLRTGQGRSKETRRASVGATNDIVLFVGDDLNDFSDHFQGDSIEARKSAVDEHRSDFGRRFVLLPNAVGGSWEKVLYHDNDLHLVELKDHFRKHYLEAFSPAPNAPE